MELDFEGVFGKSGVLKIPVGKDFYSVMHQAMMWDDAGGGRIENPGGISLPLQIRAGDTVDIGF